MMRIVTLPGGMRPAETCSASSLVRCALVSSRVSVLVVGSGGVSAAGVVLAIVAALWSVSGGVFEWASKAAERREGGLHRFGELDLLFLVGLAGGEEDDEEGEEEGDEVGIGDQPALVVDVLRMLFLAHTKPRRVWRTLPALSRIDKCEAWFRSCVGSCLREWR